MARTTRTRVFWISLVCGLVVGLAAAHLLAEAPVAKANVTSYGAPPLVPHADYTEESCTDCHGPTTHAPELGVPTTDHAERQVCRQCHVPLGAGEPFVPNTYRRP